MIFDDICTTYDENLPSNTMMQKLGLRLSVK